MNITLVDVNHSMYPIFYTFFVWQHYECLIASLDNKICFLAFVGNQSRQELLADLQQTWPTTLIEDQEKLSHFIFLLHHKQYDQLPLLLKGTSFQQEVWQQLCTVAAGQPMSYEAFAQRINKPHAVRAVANAIACNHIALLIPCHRIIYKSGQLGGYRWGIAIKKRLLEQEAVK